MAFYGKWLPEDSKVLRGISTAGNWDVRSDPKIVILKIILISLKIKWTCWGIQSRKTILDGICVVLIFSIFQKIRTGSLENTWTNVWIKFAGTEEPETMDPSVKTMKPFVDSSANFNKS